MTTCADIEHLLPSCLLFFFRDRDLIEVDDVRFRSDRPSGDAETGVVGSIGHMAGDTTWGAFGVLSQFVDRSVQGGFIHLLVGMVRAEVAAPT